MAGAGFRAAAAHGFATARRKLAMLAGTRSADGARSGVFRHPRATGHRRQSTRALVAIATGGSRQLRRISRLSCPSCPALIFSHPAIGGARHASRDSSASAHPRVRKRHRPSLRDQPPCPQIVGVNGGNGVSKAMPRHIVDAIAGANLP